MEHVIMFLKPTQGGIPKHGGFTSDGILGKEINFLIPFFPLFSHHMIYIGFF